MKELKGKLSSDKTVRFLGILWYHIATEDETKIALTSGTVLC